MHRIKTKGKYVKEIQFIHADLFDFVKRFARRRANDAADGARKIEYIFDRKAGRARHRQRYLSKDVRASESRE